MSSVRHLVSILFLVLWLWRSSSFSSSSSAALLFAFAAALAASGRKGEATQSKPNPIEVQSKPENPTTPRPFTLMLQSRLQLQGCVIFLCFITQLTPLIISRFTTKIPPTNTNTMLIYVCTVIPAMVQSLFFAIITQHSLKFV